MVPVEVIETGKAQARNIETGEWMEVEEYPIAVIVHESVNNARYARLILRSCGHDNCGVSIGFHLN